MIFIKSVIRLTVFFILMPMISLAQSDIKELIWDLQFEEAKRRASDILQSADPQSDIYKEALYQLGVCQMNLQEDDEATATFKRGLNLSQSSHHAWYLKGMAMLQHKHLNYDSALILYDEALKITTGSEKFYIQLLIDKGNMLLAIEQYKNASKLFFQAKQLYDELGISDPYLKHLVYAYIGDYHLIKNDYKNAELNLKLALSIGENIFNPDHPRMAELHESLGLTYINLENKERMLYHYRRVYEINKKGKEKGSYDLIVANNIMGMSLINAKEYKEATDYLVLAYDDMVSYFPQFDIGIHIVGMNLGITYYLSGRYELAKEYLHESIEAGRRAYGPKAQTLGEALGYLAQAYEDSGDPITALKIYDEALESNALLPSGVKLNEFTEAVDVLTLSFVLQNRARFFLERFNDERDISLLNRAKSDAELNLKILQRHQESLEPESRSSLSYELNYSYYLAVEIYWFLYQNESNEKYLDLILNNIERSKSDYLRVSLALAETKSSSNIPEEIVALDDTLQMQKEKLRARIIEGENKGMSKLPWDSLVIVQQKLDSLNSIMNDYYDNTYTYQWKPASELQNSLASNEAILDIMYQEDIIIQLLITKNSVIVQRDTAALLNDHVLTFRDEIQSLNQDFSTRGHLSKLLTNQFTELPSSISKLTIIPDGVLHYLPFDLLGVEESYLLEQYDISYANFINLKKQAMPDNDQLLSFAPDFGSDQLASLDVVRNDLTAIPGAFEEVSAINSLFLGESMTSTMATETNFKQKAKDFGIIHMATHAIVDDSNPEISRLVFNLSQDSLNDGYLHAYEIFNLDLNAKLVTLSACNTGYGKIERGEGVMSLSWAFAYAGVPATVVSLWPASDKSTPELMKYFYQNLKDGQPKDLALNNARKQYLATAQGKARHPFYWGGFVLIGDNSPIEDDTNLLVYVIPSVLVFAMILTVYRRKRKTA